MASKADYERLGGWAGVLDPQLGPDRRSAKRVVPMRVIHLGFPRSGTMSMQRAYEILGFANPYHFSILFNSIRDIDLWLEAFKAKESGTDVTPEQWRARFDQLLGHVSATTDAPTLCFWPELVAAYPEAKLVLVERDPQKWENSFLPALEALHPMGTLLRWTDPAFFGRFNRLTKCWTRHLLGSDKQDEARKKALGAYLKHYETVRATFPKDRLFEYKLGSGWEPLCEFLEVPVPDQPFPHMNEAQALKASIGVYFTRALKNSAINISIAVGIAAVVGGFLWPQVKGRLFA